MRGENALTSQSQAMARCEYPLFDASAAAIGRIVGRHGVELRLSLTMCVFMVAERAMSGRCRESVLWVPV